MTKDVESSDRKMKYKASLKRLSTIFPKIMEKSVRWHFQNVNQEFYDHKKCSKIMKNAILDKQNPGEFITGSCDLLKWTMERDRGKWEWERLEISRK